MENEVLYWSTKTVKLSQLKGLPNNPRKITPERKAKLQHWLEKYNLSDIPVINADYTIISGNQRVSILKQLHGKDYTIDVRYPNRALTEFEAKELAVVLNTHEGDFDFELLAVEFQELNLDDFNLEFPTFDPDTDAPFGDTEPGISGLDTLLGLSLRLTRDGVLPLTTVIERLTCGPARVLGLDRGHLGVGATADVCVFDAEAEGLLESTMLRSRGQNSPFIGWALPGRVTQTLLEGRVVYAREG